MTSNETRPRDSSWSKAAQRVDMLGVEISAVDLDTTLLRCGELIDSGRHGYVCTVDAHSLIESLRDADHRRYLNSAYLAVADGMPLVWLGRAKGCRALDRVYGPDL